MGIWEQALKYARDSQAKLASFNPDVIKLEESTLEGLKLLATRYVTVGFHFVSPDSF
jgi:hypothetical protein